MVITLPHGTGWLLPRELSDHNPIAISTQNCVQVNRREFIFESEFGGKIME
jgi:hypothetical protein